MRCDDFQILLHGDLDGELPPAEASRLGEHLAACEACRRVRDRQLTLRAAVKNMPPDSLRCPRV